MNAHKMVKSQWHPKVIPSGVTHDLSNQSLHPLWVTTFTISELSSHKYHPTPSPMLQ